MRWSRILLSAAVVLMGLIGPVSPRCCLAAAADDQITFDLVTSKWTVASNGTWVVDSEVTIRAPKSILRTWFACH